MTELSGIFKLIEERSFADNNCFLCGIQLNSDNKTLEHVVPRWILKKFDLWNENIILLNGTTFQYRKLTIPCCFECNNKHLEPFEKKVLNAYNAGYEEFIKLDKEVVFLWLGKIFYGLVYKELFLPKNIRKKEDGNIVSTEYLDSFYSHFLFLQGIRKKLIFKDFFPASIFYFKTQVYENNQLNWDLIDNQQCLFIAIRIGEIGIICVLQDNQITQEIDNHLRPYQEIDLHPIQFKELVAKILYKAMLIKHTPKYMNLQDEKTGIVETRLLPFHSYSFESIFNEWDEQYYAEMLSYFTGIEVETSQGNKAKSFTFLRNENGSLRFINLVENNKGKN